MIAKSFKRNSGIIALACMMTLAQVACSEHTEADRVSINPYGLTFTYEGNKSEQVTIDANTEWSIEHVPDWLTASATNGGSGTTTLTLTTKHVNNTTAVLSDSLHVRAGTARSSIPLIQKPRVDTECYARPAEELQVVLSYGFATQFIYGSSAKDFSWHICSAQEFQQLEQGLDSDLKAAAASWERHNTAERFTLLYTQCNPGSSYKLITVAYSTNNEPGGYEVCDFTTPALGSSGSPQVDLALEPAMQATAEGETVWQWHSTPKGSLKEYVTYACAGPEKFRSYQLAEAETEHRRRGLWLAYEIHAKRKMSGTTEKSGLTEENSTLNINFGPNGNRSCHEVLYEAINYASDLTVHATSADRYLEVFTWCVSNTSGQFIGTVADSIYTIENGRIVTGGETPQPVEYHTTATPDSLSFESSAGSQNITVTSNEQWTATSDAMSWCTVFSTSGSGNGTVKVTVTANTSTTQRTAQVTITGKTSSDVTKVKVIQMPLEDDGEIPGRDDNTPPY